MNLNDSHRRLLNCSRCGIPTAADEDSEAVVCGRCAVKIENFLDNQVLTPQNCKDMRLERGLSPLQAAKMADKDTYPAQIKRFEAGTGKCPAGIVSMLYEWWLGG